VKVETKQQNQIQKAVRNSAFLRKELKEEAFNEKAYSSYANPPSRRIQRC